MTDYEKAPRTVLKKMFPLAELRACWFHFTQAVRRRAAKMPHVFTLIRHDLSAKKAFYKLLSLPLLKPEQIWDGFEIVRLELMQCDAAFEPLLDYFHSQWMLKVFGNIFFLYILCSMLIYSFPFLSFRKALKAYQCMEKRLEQRAR